MDDAFRSTNNANYADGYLDATGGRDGGGGLILNLGGVDNKNKNGISGAFVREFTLSEPGTVEITFWYSVTMSKEYETGEDSEVLCRLDGQLYGPGDSQIVETISGDDNASSNIVVNWKEFTFQVDLEADQTHVLELRGYNNR